MLRAMEGKSFMPSLPSPLTVRLRDEKTLRAQQYHHGNFAQSTHRPPSLLAAPVARASEGFPILFTKPAVGRSSPEL